MDRTREFQSLLDPKSTSAAGNQILELTPSSESTARSGFNAEAARIGQEIHIAQLKLDELGKGMAYALSNNETSF